MTKLEQLIIAVKEENLTKTQLEDYFKEVTELRVDIKMQRAVVKKEKALFMVKRDAGESISSRKEVWDASDTGQRLIDLDTYVTVTRDLLDSIRTRIYSLL